MSRGDRPRAVLLDTCALIWLAEGAPMADEALAVEDLLSRVGAPPTRGGRRLELAAVAGRA